MARLQYLNRIDPNVTAEDGRRILAAQIADLGKLRPKARKAAEDTIALIRADILALEMRS